jgi:hypothetical protein
MCLKLICTLACLATSFATAVCPSTPIDISTTVPLPVNADNSQIGTDSNGNAVAIWREYDGTNTYIKSASYLSSVGWQAPLLVSTTLGSNDTNQAPQISVNFNSGGAYAIWLENSNTIKTSRLPFGGAWTTPDILSVSAAALVGDPQIADFITAPQDAVAVWVQNTGTNNFIQSAFFNGTVWSAPIDIVPSTTDNLRNPQVGFASFTFTAYAIWENNTTNQIQSASSTGGAWSSSLNVGASSGVAPRLAVGIDGRLTAVWPFFSGVNFDIHYSQFSAGSWSLPQNLSTSNSGGPSVAMDPSANTMIVWQDRIAPGIFAIHSAYIAPFGTTPTLYNVTSAAPTASLPDVDMDIAGNAYAVWRRDVAANFVIQFATFPFGGSSWSPVCDVSATNEDSSIPQISSTAVGKAVMVWPNNTNIVIQAALFPPAPIVTSIDPTSGSTSGGNTVLITGTDLSDVMSVEFGAGNLASFTIISSTQIIAVVPPSVPLDTPGAVSVIVTSPSGSATVTYTYASPICWQR